MVDDYDGEIDIQRDEEAMPSKITWQEKIAKGTGIHYETIEEDQQGTERKTTDMGHIPTKGEVV